MLELWEELLRAVPSCVRPALAAGFPLSVPQQSGAGGCAGARSILGCWHHPATCRDLCRGLPCVLCAETLSREGNRPELGLQLHERVLSSPCSLLCGLETHSSALCTPARQGKLCSVLEGTMHCSSGAGAGGEANLSVQNAVFDESFPTKYRSFCHQVTEGCSSPKDLVDWALVPCRVSAPAVPAAEQV